MPATITPPPEPVGPQVPDVAAYVGLTRLVWAKAIEYEDVHNDMGSWSFSISNSEYSAGDRALLDYGESVAFVELGETNPAFVGIVEEITQTTVAEGEEKGQFTTYSGRGILAELDRAIIYGPLPILEWAGGALDGLRLAAEPYPDVRYHNYATPTRDRSAFETATNMVQAGQTPAQWPPGGYVGCPVPWPFPDAYWIAPRAASGGAHPPGDWYAHGTCTTAAAFSYDMVAAVGPGDEAWIWWDGVLVAHLDAKDALKPHLVNIKANDATHDIIVRVRHGGSNSSGDITGLILAVFRHYDDGGGWVLAPLTYTSASTGWTVLDYPATSPGYTPDAVIDEYITEAQDRPGDLLAGWTTDWDPGEDSNGDPMIEATEFFRPVGSKIIDALKAMSENYIEFGVDPANRRNLQIWTIPGLPLPGGGTAPGGGSASGVTLEPGDNVLSLTHHGTAPETTRVLVKWAEGYMELFTDYGERAEGFLSLEDGTDGIQVFWDGAAQMVNLSTPGESIEGLRHKMSAETQYRVRDTVTAPDRDGDMVTWRVVSRGVTVDENGRATVTTSLGTPRDTEEARNDRWRRKVLGTLDGRSESSSPLSRVVQASETLNPVRLRFGTGGSGVTIVGDRGEPERPDQTLLVVGFELEADVAGASGGTTVHVEKNAVAIGSATIPVSQNYARVWIDPVLITVTDQTNVETTAAGGHQGVAATLICMAATR